jgi:malic enzyme
LLVQAVAGRWPNAVIQFEDFETTKAVPLLAKYRDVYHCFNDDIQGTGCVTLAGIIAASRAAKGSIRDMKFLCAGAGSAGLGVCSQIVDGLMMEGLTKEEALKRFVVVTHKGVLGKAQACLVSSHFISSP